MRPRRPFIPQRERLYLGCEGRSEESYGAFLQRLVDDADLPVAIRVDPLNPGAGSAVELVRRAIQRRDRYGRYAFRLGSFVLLDSDRRPGGGRNPQETDAARRFAIQAGMGLVWQQANHEALLLRHFPGHERDNPPPADCFNRLRQVMPGYEKGWGAAAYRRHLDQDSLQRGAIDQPELRILLLATRLLQL